MNPFISSKTFPFVVKFVCCFLVWGNLAQNRLSASEPDQKTETAVVLFSPQNRNTQTAKKNEKKNNAKDVKKDAKKDVKKEEPPNEVNEPPQTDAFGMELLKGRRFITRDGVMLEGSYYPGSKSKETVPVVLLHGQGKSRDEFAPLISALKQRDYAIMTFDFRGHGKSTKRISVTKIQGQVEPQQADPPRHFVDRETFADPFSKRHREKQAQQTQQAPRVETYFEPGPMIEYVEKEFKADDYKRMFTYDCDPFQKILVALNNREVLNLHKLVIVGFDMGGSIGAKWAKQNPRLVKSLIVLDPNSDAAALSFFKNSKVFQKDVPVLFIVGKLNQEAKAKAERLRDELLGKEKEKNDDPYSLSSIAPILDIPTDRRGSDMFSDSKLELPQKIIQFIEIKLDSAKEKDLKWKKI